MGHALNTRAMALKYAKDKGLDYNSLNLIVAHVGGGATVYLHEHGQMSDMISDDERAMALKYAKDKGLDYNSLNLIVAHVGGGATVYLHEHGQMSDMISDDEGPLALKYAKDKGLDYNSLNLIVAHVGGGATVYLHEHGQMSDMISDDEGPFSPDRSGRVPCIALIEECYANKFSLYDMKKKIRGKGGIYSYLNTNDLRKVEEMIANGDKYAEIVYDAMVYQMAKAIGEMATVVDGNVDAIIVTGGIAYSNMFTSKLMKKVGFISHVEIMPGENEMESLAFGALRVLKGEEIAREFK